MSEEKNDNIVSAEEFFQQSSFKDLNVKVEDYTQKKKSLFAKCFQSFGSLATVFILSIIAGTLIAVIPITYISGAMPIIEPVADSLKNMPSELEEVAIAERNKMYDTNGNVFAEFWTEDRIILDDINKISDNAKNALIAAEDSRYYDHQGIDIISTGRAILDGSGGASGITQQLVKNLQFYNMAGKEKQGEATEQTYNRKLRELKLALSYENDHSKDEILLRYFNTVSFGSANIYSIEAASQYFFGKSSADLTIAEASALIGTVQNPSLYDLENPEAKELWKERQSYVLWRMVEEEYITQEEADAAFEEELVFTLQGSSSGNCSTSSYPSYCEYVIKELLESDKLGETLEERQAILAKGGLQIKTYLNPAIMDTIDRTLKEDFGTWNRVVAPAAIVQPGTGGLEGFGVNRNYGNGPEATVINVADNPAGTGSTYKPFVLAAAINAGLTEADLTFGSACPLYPPGYDSPPSGFTNSVSCAFQGGVMDYQKATAWSSNTWYVTLAARIGLDKVAELSKTLNLNVPDNVLPGGMSFALGTVENSTIDMAAAYATFANDGIFCPATSVVSYEYVDGTAPVVPETYVPGSDGCVRAMSPYAASVVLKSMRANTNPGYVDGAFGLKGTIPGFDAVGKSGTNEHTNFTWGQVMKNHSLFINMYDMDETQRGADYIWYRGYMQQNLLHAEAGSRVLSAVLQATGEGNVPLNFNATDRSSPPVPVEKKEFFTVPSVKGMEAAEAVAVLESFDIKVQVSKEKRKASDGYPSGVIVEQSISAGEELPVGTKKDIILYESK